MNTDEQIAQLQADRDKWRARANDALEKKHEEQFLRAGAERNLEKAEKRAADAETKLAFLKAKGIVAGILKDERGETMQYVIEPGSELCDGDTLRKLRCAEVARDLKEGALIDAVKFINEYAQVCWWCSNNGAQLQHGHLFHPETMYTVVLIGHEHITRRCYHDTTPGKAMEQAKAALEANNTQPADYAQLNHAVA
jgi:hypothetical protein